MRIPSLVALLPLAVAACSGPPQPRVTTTAADAVPPPAAVPVAATVTIPGFAGPVAPLAGPVALRYAPAAFHMAVTIEVSDSQGARPSTLAAATDGRLATEGQAIRATLVTDRLEVDGRPDPRLARLVQDILMTPAGTLLDLASRLDGGPGDAPLPERYRALEKRWRDRLPELAAAPLATGDEVLVGNDPLAPLRQLLHDQAMQVTPTRPLRLTAAGTAACGSGRCLVARRDGAAILESPGRRLEASVGGYALLDLATAVVVEAQDVIELADPAAAAGSPSRLTVRVRTLSELQPAGPAT